MTLAPTSGLPWDRPKGYVPAPLNPMLHPEAYAVADRQHVTVDKLLKHMSIAPDAWIADLALVRDCVLIKADEKHHRRLLAYRTARMKAAGFAPGKGDGANSHEAIKPLDKLCRACRKPLPLDAPTRTRYHADCRPSTLKRAPVPRRKPGRPPKVKPTSTVSTCACGCGKPLPDGSTARRRFLNVTHRNRVLRRAKV